jgi:hypothetical protein
MVVGEKNAAEQSSGGMWSSFSADFESWQGQFQGQSWDNRQACKSQYRLYLAFPRGDVA